MTARRVDLKVVADRLALVTHCRAELRGLPTSSLGEFSTDSRNPLAAYEALRRALEVLLDVTRHMLTGTAGNSVQARRIRPFMASNQCLTCEATA